MADTKYGHLVKALAYRGGFMGKANAKKMTINYGKDLEGFNLNFIIGVYDDVGDWAPNRGAHTHPFDEFLFFFGYDPNDLRYLGSDMELALGKEYEQHFYSVPTAVAIPKDFPHCPLLTNKVYKPFGHFHLALSPKAASGHVEKEGTTDGNRYTHYIKTLEIKEGPRGGDADQYWFVQGCDLSNLPVNVKMGLHKKTGQIDDERGTHVHPYDECLIFFGHNTEEPTYLGAELTIELGTEHEKHNFNQTTVICIPKGMPHFPLVCTSLADPYRFVQIGLAPKYESRRVA